MPTVARTALALAALLAALPAAATERSEIPDRYKWKLAELYPSDAAWWTAREALAKRIPALSRHRGHLGDSAAALAGALDDAFGAQEAMQRLSVYATSRADEDTRVAAPL